MHLRIQRAVVVALVVLCSASGVAQQEARHAGRPAPGDAPYGRFGARLFAALAKERGGDSNTVMSPVSAGIALALVAGGAKGPTYDALTHALDADGLTASALAQRDSLLLSALSSRKDVTLEVANALWLSPRYNVQPSYVIKGAQAYRSEVSRVALDSALGVDRVNAWAAEKTHGKISRVLNGPLSDSAAMVVTNAVYFRGIWQTDFDVKATRPMAFHARPNVTDSVPGMEQTARFVQWRDSGMQVVRLPYRGERASLLVILPDSGVRIEDVESRLAQVGLRSTHRGQEPREVHIRIPRVHAEMSIDLKPTLKQLGASIAFDCKRADFSAMLLIRADQRACINGAMQKVFVDIDEKGTEAAAVTSVDMMVAAGFSPTIEFIVDRPFLIVLRDEVSGVPLFMGRIVQPGTSTKTR